MHWFRASMVLLSLAAVAASGCVSPKADLSDLSGSAGGDGFQEQLQGAVRAPVPVVDRATRTTTQAPAPEPEPVVDEAPEPANTTQEPPASENTTDEAPVEPEPAPEPVDRGACVPRIEIDHAQSIFYAKGTAGTARDEQVVSAWWRILSGDVVRSGIAIGREDADDFCHIEDAYPCVWGDAFPRTDYDRYAERDGRMVYFGFSNVHTGDAYNDVSRWYTNLVVRGWAELSDGTLVLDRNIDTAQWGHIQVRSGTDSIAERDEAQLCDLVEAGILPP